MPTCSQTVYPDVSGGLDSGLSTDTTSQLCGVSAPRCEANPFGGSSGICGVFANNDFCGRTAPGGESNSFTYYGEAALIPVASSSICGETAPRHAANPNNNFSDSSSKYPTSRGDSGPCGVCISPVPRLKSADQVMQNYPELCTPQNVKTLAKKN